jgi:hypothetical protein
LLANQLFRVQGDTAKELLDGLARVWAGKSIFYYLAWYAIFRLLVDGSSRRVAQRADIAFALFITFINFLPANSIHWFSATAAGLYILATSADDDRLSAAATVLVAVTLNGFWGPFAFDFFASYLLRADAALVGTLLSVAQQSDIRWHETVVGVPGAHSIIVYGPCSSFHNISLGLLCWVTMTKLVRTNWVRGDVVVALLICATVILLNASRLSILALNADNFEFWHVGLGAELFNWATTLAVLAISIWGAFRAPQTR